MFSSQAFDDDQLVPQFEDVKNSSGGEGVQIESRPITDLDTLLSDIANTLDAEYGGMDVLSWQQPPAYHAPQHHIYPSHHYSNDDITFYDDPMPLIKKEKTMFSPQEEQKSVMFSSEPSLQSELMHPKIEPSSDLSCHSEQSSDDTPYDLSVQNELDLEHVKRDLECTCALLNIPPDPYSWSVEDVRKWAEWTLKQYNLQTRHLDAFDMDGTNLCMLSEEDFYSRSQDAGQYLFGQLEYWKSAYCSLTSAQSALTTPSYDDTLTYTDLTPMGQQQHHSQQPQHQHQQQQHQQQQPQHAHQSSVCAYSMASMVAVSSADGTLSYPINIPKPVFTSPISLSPSPSIDSLDSNCSSMASCHSETDDMMLAGGEVTPTKQNIHLWQFLRELLLSPRHYGGCIRWLDRTKGIFKIEDSARVARLWGLRKNRPAMNYDKLSRSIRQYYKKGIIKKTDNSKRLVYQFCPQYRV